MSSQTNEQQQWAQTAAVLGPPAMQLALEVIRTIRTTQPEIITPEQWDQLRQLVSEPYDERKARIEAEMRAAGQLR